MPQLLRDGLPEKARRSRFDFARWADGQAWKFVKGDDYTSSTQTFRHNVLRWARSNGFRAEFRAYPAVDGDGNELPLTKADAVALGVVLRPAQASANGDKPTASPADSRPRRGA